MKENRKHSRSITCKAIKQTWWWHHPRRSFRVPPLPRAQPAGFADDYCGHLTQCIANVQFSWIKYWTRELIVSADSTLKFCSDLLLYRTSRYLVLVYFGTFDIGNAFIKIDHFSLLTCKYFCQNYFSAVWFFRFG